MAANGTTAARRGAAVGGGGALPERAPGTGGAALDAGASAAVGEAPDRRGHGGCITADPCRAYAQSRRCAVCESKFKRRVERSFQLTRAGASASSGVVARIASQTRA